MQSIMSDAPVLTLMALVPAAGSLLLWVVPPLRRQARALGLLVSLGTLGLGLYALSQFDLAQGGTVQLGELHSWIPVLGVS